MKKSLSVTLLLCGVMASNAYAAPSKKDVLNHYADLAFATYSDSLTTAQVLQQHLVKLLDKPTLNNLEQAKQAWKDARVPYQQTEVFRFGNAVVD